MSRRLGLLAGVGRLPVESALAARATGCEVFAVGLLAGVDPQLRDVVSEYADISVAKLGSIIDWLKARGVREITVIGKVTKELLMSGDHPLPDWRTAKLLWSLPNRKDDTIMLTFVAEMAKEGITVVDQTALVQPLMPSAGVLTRRAPTDGERRDMSFGFGVAKELGRLDIGQTVVVKGLAVMALEAIEGTDACIARGGKLARGGAVVVKVAKPSQDLRFDVPAVGLQTLEQMVAVNATALALEAGRTLLVDRAAVIAYADAHRIALAAIEQ